MLKTIKKIKRAWQIAGRESEEVSPEVLRKVLEGDGKAEFLPDFTEAELEIYEKEQRGWNMKNFLKNFNL